MLLTMGISQVLAGVIAGGGLTILGTWLGARWQATEARRVRIEQYTREDRLRDRTERREMYVRFARHADRGIGSTINNHDGYRELADIVVDLSGMCWDLELVATPRVVAAARQVVDAVDDAVKHPDHGFAAVEVFIREARNELGLPMSGLPPMEAWDWTHNHKRRDKPYLPEPDSEAAAE
jgi:hypothetical protein